MLLFSLHHFHLNKRRKYSKTLNYDKTNYKRIILSICIIDYSCLISPFLSASAGLSLRFQVATILDKNVKKNARFMFNFRILPSKARFTQDTPPSPPKNNVEVWSEHFCSLLNNIDQGGVGGGVTMVPNTQGGCPVCKKEQNS